MPWPGPVTVEDEVALSIPAGHLFLDLPPRLLVRSPAVFLHSPALFVHFPAVLPVDFGVLVGVPVDVLVDVLVGVCSGRPVVWAISSGGGGGRL
jgi:hypothetical protein